MEQLSFHWTDCHEICCLSIFWKSVVEIQVSLQHNKNSWARYMKTNMYFYHSSLNTFRMRNVWTKVVDKVKTHILCSITFFQKLCHMWDNVEKYFRARQTAYDNMAHAHCMLDTYGYKYMLRICNTNWFSTATVVARMHLSVILYVYCLPCYNRWKVFTAQYTRGVEIRQTVLHVEGSTAVMISTGMDPVLLTVCLCWQIETQDVLLVTPEQGLVFPAAEYIRDVVFNHSVTTEDGVVVVVEGTNVYNVDSTVAKVSIVYF